MKNRNILLVSAGCVVLLAVVGYVRTAGRSPGQVSAERIADTARRLVEAGPAAEGLPSKDRVQALLEEELKDAGARVKALPFQVEVEGHGTWHLVNVVGSYRPEAKRRLLVGTHWDTRPWADEDPDPAKRGLPVPGANDGVSGAAVLLELARALEKNPPPPDTGVDLVFFDGEEGPKGGEDYFLGSKHLAETWFELGLAPPTKGVVLDMVGKKGLRIRRELTSDQFARSVNDRIFGLAKTANAQVFRDEKGKKIGDDHLAFHRRQIPVALLIDLDYPEWHTTADTLDKLDPEAMAQVGEVVLAWIREEAASAR
jgi:glutaminyl-peptide cyclotransferase